MKRNRRKRKWLRSPLQFKVVLLVWGVAVALAFVMFQLSVVGLFTFDGVADTRGFVGAMLPTLLKCFLLTLALSVPFATILAVNVSFRFCGPLYRFQQYFKDLPCGRWDKPCRIRAKDDLQDLNALINTGLETLVETVAEQHKLLDEFGALVASSPDAFPDTNKARRLEERATELGRYVSQRLGESDGKETEAEKHANLDRQETVEVSA